MLVYSAICSEIEVHIHENKVWIINRYVNYQFKLFSKLEKIQLKTNNFKINVDLKFSLSVGDLNQAYYNKTLLYLNVWI